MNVFNNNYTQTTTDQLGNSFKLIQKPNRIISLVPSQTELLHYLGLENEVIAITKFCVHPHNWFKNKTRIGGTKNLNIQKIKLLKPDLIIGNKEENNQAQILELQNHFPVWMSDIYTLHDAFKMIESIAKITDASQQATDLIFKIKTEFSNLKNKKTHHNKVVYLIWNEPMIAAGGNTFINSMLNEIGFENAIEAQRYPAIDLQQLQNLQPDYIFLSSEPFPFKHAHITALKKHMPNTKIMLVNGEMFSWYGSRLLNATNYFNDLLSKEI